MKQTITYSLKANNDTSDEYYLIIKKFAAETSLYINKVMEQELKMFKSFIQQEELEVLRSKEEYGIEILMLGVFWINYKDEALMQNAAMQKVLHFVVLQREKGLFHKNVSDFLKGKLITLMYSRRNSCSAKDKKNQIEVFSKLLSWLEASGDFKHEAKRLVSWMKFITAQPIERGLTIINKIIAVAGWFETASYEALGKYTENVENYIKKSLADHKGKEDFLFCGKPRLEYHLNMVGAEIMNNALRETFLKQPQKAVFLPQCMCRKGEKNCRAAYSQMGYLCTHCDKECSVNSLCIQGKHNQFKVYIIPHESDFYREKAEHSQRMGIIGVACVLNLLEGGFKAIEMGFIPQCVILNCCGCKKHWHKAGIVTEINMLRLKQILE